MPFNFKNKLEVFNTTIPEAVEDPLLNLEVLCAMMVLIKKDLLLESDFSMCLGYLWKYELRDPDAPPAPGTTTAPAGVPILLSD